MFFHKWVLLLGSLFTLEAIIYIIKFTLGPMTQATFVMMIYQSTQMSTTWVAIMKFVTPQSGNKQTNKPSLQRKSSALLKEPRREGAGRWGKLWLAAKGGTFSYLQCIRGEFWCWDGLIEWIMCKRLFFNDDTSGISEEVLDVTKKGQKSGAV